MKNIFFFDSMLTPKIITFVYWLLLLASVLSGVTRMFAGYDASFVYGLFIIVSGCVGAIERIAKRGVVGKIVFVND